MGTLPALHPTVEHPPLTSVARFGDSLRSPFLRSHHSPRSALPWLAHKKVLASLRSVSKRRLAPRHRFYIGVHRRPSLRSRYGRFQAQLAFQDPHPSVAVHVGKGFAVRRLGGALALPTARNSQRRAFTIGFAVKLTALLSAPCWRLRYASPDAAGAMPVFQCRTTQASRLSASPSPRSGHAGRSASQPQAKPVP